MVPATDPEHAAYAINELLEPESALPIHCRTPPLEGTPDQFAEALGDIRRELIRMKPGNLRTFD